MSAAERPQRHLHGRRRGHGLTAKRQRLIDDLLPRLAVPEGPGRLDAETLFGDDRTLWLEIGFGGGEHLAWQAERHGDLGFIGAEPYINGVAALLAAIDERDLANVRIRADDVGPVLERLAPASLARVFILFPDPWPKTRHHKRRIVNGATIARLAELMADGAELRLATDDMAYARWMMTVMAANGEFRWTARRPGDWRERPADWPGTRYEAKALRAGRRPVFLRFVR
ncbi:MAG: tRNA (guanosine(46)-N7)-methyltransferase TrmB, partial [Hyphomicrobiales bacterium]